ncbi:MAG: thiamine biosynthesis protein ThiS [Elusimicrobia bacterium RIFOXYB2_FULL_49_7]|nr:MAG: thiamine biosynthesis protein ThiS [Elusimicrobia bacterium RIFOXYB2_FULL_49_7]
MNILLNGATRFAPDNATLLRILTDYKIKPDTVAVEYNGRILPKDDFDKTNLSDNDTVEILHFVGGG